MSSIPYLVGWNAPGAILAAEARQLVEEGRDPLWIENYLKEVNGKKPEAEIWTGLNAAPELKDFSFVEPSDLEGIRVARANGMRKQTVTYSDEVLLDRMYGAWLGRCCGCALGKPVERFMGPHNGLTSKERIKTYLEGISPAEYPLNDYFPLTSPAEAKTEGVGCHASCRENIQFMESDDDIRYTVLGQQILHDKGVEFTSLDVMKTWINKLSYRMVCTAESQAYRNYVMRYHVYWGTMEEVDWSWVATHQNPYREWIGAQIRADSFGYAAPGNPELAAELAWRDARISHVKNGIYGEMFAAAMIAAGFVLDDPLAVIEAGLAEIPQTSRLYQDMKETMALCQKHGCEPEAFEAVLDGIFARFGHYDPVHTNNNAAVVVAALLLGGRDFQKVITIAAMAGLDTDCNGATAGSIFGAMYGAENIPVKWKGRLNDTLHSAIIDYHPIAISECARRSTEIAKKVLAGT